MNIFIAKSSLTIEASSSQMLLYALKFVCKSLSFQKTTKNSYLFRQSLMVSKFLKITFSFKYSLLKDVFLNCLCTAELRPYT